MTEGQGGQVAEKGVFDVMVTAEEGVFGVRATAEEQAAIIAAINKVNKSIDFRISMLLREVFEGAC